MWEILLRYQDSFFVHLKVVFTFNWNCFALHEVIGWNVHAVTRVECRVLDSDEFRVGISFKIGVEEVQWAIIFGVLLINTDVNILSKYWIYQLEFFFAFYDAHITFIVASFWQPSEILPNGDVFSKRPQQKVQKTWIVKSLANIVSNFVPYQT